MDVVVRVVIVYLLLLLCFRVLGKREVGKLSPFELVTLMIVPEMVSEALTQDDHSITNAVAGVTTLFVLLFATSVLTFRFPRLGRAVENPATLLVADGKLLEHNLNTERVSTEELFAEMHKAGIDRLEDVRWAVLESDGRIAILPRTNPAAGAEELPA